MTLITPMESCFKLDYAQTLNQKDLWLGERCAITPKGDYLVRQKAGGWRAYTAKNAAKLDVMQNWGGLPHHLTEADVKIFMSSIAPVVTGMLRAPNCKAPALEFAGEVYVNSWHNTMIASDPDVIFGDILYRDKLTLLLRMIRESLCAREGSYDLDEMMRRARSQDPAELEWRFVINWLAAGVQNPGCNLQTNLWFLGELGGSGKGTLNTIMSMIYGPQLCITIAAEEMEKHGWTDQIAGCLLGCINELEWTNKFDWNIWIKKYCNEEVITLTKRNHGSFKVPNFCNWLIFSNDECPAKLDINDRRNMLVATTHDPKKVALAQELRNFMGDHPAEFKKVVAGFVHLLHQHSVDRVLISKAQDTPIRLEIQRATAKDADWLTWLREDPNYPRDTWLSARQWMDHFDRWQGTHRAGKMKVGDMGRLLSKLARHGHVVKYVRYEADGKEIKDNRPGRYLVNSETYPAFREDEMPSDTPARKEAKNKLLALVAA